MYGGEDSSYCAIEGEPTDAKDFADLDDHVAEEEELHFSVMHMSAIEALPLRRCLHPPSPNSSSLHIRPEEQEERRHNRNEGA